MSIASAGAGIGPLGTFGKVQHRQLQKFDAGVGYRLPAPQKDWHRHIQQLDDGTGYRHIFQGAGIGAVAVKTLCEIQLPVNRTW